MNRFLERISYWSGVFAGVSLFAMAVLISVDVFKRWITVKPFPGIFEFSEIGFLIITFVAYPLTEHLGRQMSIDLLTTRIKGRASYLVKAWVSIVGLFFWAALLWLGIGEWVYAYEVGDIRRGLIGIPTVIHLSFLAYGVFLVCLGLLNSFVRSVGVAAHLLQPDHSVTDESGKPVG